MDRTLPMFPLGAVVFPGMTLPLHIFEDRYRALVTHLLTLPEQERFFGVVAIREGYEVGTHGMQSAHRVGCVVQLVASRAYPDGRYDIGTVGRSRLRLESMDSSGDFLLGSVVALPDQPGPQVDAATATAERAFEVYRSALEGGPGVHLPEEDLPDDPVARSYALAAAAALTLREQQELLECEDAASRMRLLTVLLRQELDAMRAVPSLPATELSRTAWSPN